MQLLTRKLFLAIPIAFALSGTKFAAAQLSPVQIQWQYDSIRTVSAAVYTPDKSKIIVAGGLGVQIINATTGVPILRIPATFNSTPAFALSPNGQTFAIGGLKSGSTTGVLETYSVSTGKRIASLNPQMNIVRSVAYSKDGKTLAVGGYTQVDLNTTKGVLQLWNTSTNKIATTLASTETQINSVALSKDGKTLVNAGTAFISGSSDRNAVVEVWNLATGTQTQSLVTTHALGQSVALAPDGKTLALGAKGINGFQPTTSILELWDYTTGSKVSELSAPGGGIDSVVFSPDGTELADSGFSATAELRTASGQLVKQMATGAYENYGIAFAADGDSLLIGGMAMNVSALGVINEIGMTQVFSVPNGTLMSAFNTTTQRPVAAAFSRDGQTLATGGLGSTSASFDMHAGLSLWNVADGSLLSTQTSGALGFASGVEGVAYSPDGTTLVDTGTYYNPRTKLSSGLIELRNATTGELKGTLASAANLFLNGVAFSPDGKILVTGGDQYSSPSTYGVLEFWDTSTGKLIARKRAAMPISALAFSPDGKTLVTAETGQPGYSGGLGAKVEAWNVSKSQLINTIFDIRLLDYAGSIAFSPDGKLIAVGGASTTDRGPEFAVCDAVTGNSIVSFSVGIGIGSVNGVAFSADGKVLFLASQRLQAYSTKTFHQLGVYNPGLSGGIDTSTVTISPNGRQIAFTTLEGGVSLFANPLGGTANISRLALNHSTVTGGANVTGTVYLASAAPEGGNYVTLTGGNSAAPLPEFVLVPAGATSATFTIQTVPVSGMNALTIDAGSNNTHAVATLVINPPLPTSLAISPISVFGGQSATGKVTVNGVAPVGGIAVPLLSGDTSVVVPATVVVPAGQTTATFPITTLPVVQTIIATVFAGENSFERTAKITVNPATIKSLTLTPTSVQGGSATVVTGTATLSSPAPTGGIVVTITSSNSLATTAAHMTIPAGQTSGTFNVTHKKVTTNATVTFTAKVAGVAKTATLTLTP